MKTTDVVSAVSSPPQLFISARPFSDGYELTRQNGERTAMFFHQTGNLSAMVKESPVFFTIRKIFSKR